MYGFSFTVKADTKDETLASIEHIARTNGFTFQVGNSYFTEEKADLTHVYHCVDQLKANSDICNALEKIWVYRVKDFSNFHNIIKEQKL